MHLHIAVTLLTTWKPCKNGQGQEMALRKNVYMHLLNCMHLLKKYVCPVMAWYDLPCQSRCVSEVGRRHSTHVFLRANLDVLHWKRAFLHPKIQWRTSTTTMAKAKYHPPILTHYCAPGVLPATPLPHGIPWLQRYRPGRSNDGVMRGSMDCSGAWCSQTCTSKENLHVPFTFVIQISSKLFG